MDTAPPPDIGPPLGVIGRAVRLRCPVCGVGPLFRGFTALPECSNCHFRFEREAGYFTNSIAFNYIIVGTAITCIIVPLAYFGTFGVRGELILGLGMAVLLPILCLLHVRALWLAVDVIVRPPTAPEFSDIDRR